MSHKKLRKILASLLVCIIPCCFISCSKNDDSNLQTVKLNEVARSVFYAPMYVAINEGFFEEEGLKIDLSTGQGADKTMQQTLSNSVDIGFCGPEQVIYINNQGREDYPVLFAQLTKKDGSFLIGKEKDDNFTYDKLKGKKVLGARPGGVPQMSLEYALKKNNINPVKDVNMTTNVAYTATAGAFKASDYDYVALFEPTGSMLEKDGTGYIVSSIGEENGEMPYTCFFCTKSYMDKNPEVLEKFTRAIYKAQKWVNSHSDEEVATSIESFFEGTDHDIIVNVVKNYRSIDAFSSDPKLTEDGMNKLMDVIESYDKSLIPERPDFNKIVNNSFAEKAINSLD